MSRRRGGNALRDSTLRLCVLLITHIGDLPLRYRKWVLVQTALLYLQGLSGLRRHTAVGTILHISLQHHASKHVNVHSTLLSTFPRSPPWCHRQEMMIFRADEGGADRRDTPHQGCHLTREQLWLQQHFPLQKVLGAHTWPAMNCKFDNTTAIWGNTVSQLCVRLTLHTPEGRLTSNPCFNFDFLKSSCFHTFFSSRAVLINTKETTVLGLQTFLKKEARLWHGSPGRLCTSDPSSIKLMSSQLYMPVLRRHAS